MKVLTSLSLLFVFFAFGCGKPLSSQKTLLVSLDSGECIGVDCESESDPNASTAIEIGADSSTMSSLVTESDTVDIGGGCVDQDNKANRILVEVFAGEDETVNPYINNDISDSCIVTNNAVSSGIESSEVRMQNHLLIAPGQNFNFTPTGGLAPYSFSIISGDGSFAGATYTASAPVSERTIIARVTDSNSNIFHATIQKMPGVTTPVANSPPNKCFWVTHGIGVTEGLKTYPQCHNGRFGFRVRLGKPQKYTVLFKLRTLGGVPQETVRSRVVIDRTFPVPVLNSLSQDNSRSVTISASPARFNLNIGYSLNKMFKDILVTGDTTMASVYTHLTTTALIPQRSVFEHIDTDVVQGVSYTYSLVATDFSSPAITTPLSQASGSLTVEMPRPKIENSQAATNTACYLAFVVDANSYHNSANTYEWGVGVNLKGWTMPPLYNNNSGITTVPACTNSNNTCTITGLTPNNSYFFAVRARRGTIIGKWSDEVLCKTTGP